MLCARRRSVAIGLSPAVVPARRCLSQTRALLARTKFTKLKQKVPPAPRANVRLPTQQTAHSNKLRITQPIEPSKGNLNTSLDHPLWQFFHEGQFIRDAAQLDTRSRSWSIPELRRKSFEDLHALWYACLRERNVLVREIHLIRTALRTEVDAFTDVDERIRTTMWRIRHVLSERDVAFRRAQETTLASGGQEGRKFAEQFAERFVNDTETPEEELWEKLQRFQLAVFGISEIIEDNRIDRPFIDGIKFVANLKMRRFAKEDPTLEGHPPITDVGEAFVLFTSENDLKSTREAYEVVKELREQGKSVPRLQEVQTVTRYIEQLAGVDN
ncbi:mitochondrial 54S ribosomal protein uL29m KNAG_0B06570 [Huiozyma naganishii CBS 8797]|uniref:Large ribosomal subunit protein uL29m n=1 Tax=Huiozyma naganishii (strain ATCC MYA-139 / BCRC 22969 / CBS 8797 / KCTC 17520 / NBRC 10181 / NCYC 3082 / Yp74L-3) TaxID=1071383 RepID=J7S449_HUIN7|nr:hypothetical protein KNAG_0B06570 [Kazachstania naganishii CBS 8797]CCK69084.1 hypothetical protein KNAG_0B06570 [Kazachstania naganishii CBS 8797]